MTDPDRLPVLTAELVHRAAEAIRYIGGPSSQMEALESLIVAVRPWVPLADQFRRPLFMRMDHTAPAACLAFEWRGPDQRSARDNFVAAIRAAALSAQGWPQSYTGPTFGPPPPPPVKPAVAATHRMDELADRLRDNPTPDELKRAAAALEAMGTVLAKL